MVWIDSLHLTEGERHDEKQAARLVDPCGHFLVKDDRENAYNVLRPVRERFVLIMVAKEMFRLLLLMGLALSMTAALADTPPQNASAPQSDSIDVKVQITGDTVTIDMSLVVPATRQQVWAVLTDFEHMAGFVSNLKESKVIGTSGTVLKIYQRGSASYALIDFPFESTREIQLTPFDKIQSHMISGNMTRMEGTTQLIEESGGTRIVYHADTIPGHWLPPFGARSFIEHETRAQFVQMRDEILRRKSSSVAQNN